ncbi:GntR family transcriptional regulator [Conexibacter stalactiti]|uniref:GntR family transcriptional regulator n=1 Tax=Conexibacter stalactiti TaxID=1940611 RepID=A0ABU4HP01_9ACTN|nr:GntR family transcriptional regulator [Conexibacter stalactiti]MDW5595041.1 GntR family transcriptional regulator [Conexibacter stalactiti]MEC5035683.1 GntR family transcriptional regulator [Conexibacter stalactiti]
MVSNPEAPRQARDVLYATLLDGIVQLRYPPGARLSDVAVAAELGVSRTPAREAILRLADEGLVAVRPRSGTFVTPIDRHAVREAQFVREALEVAALQAAMANRERLDFDALAANIAGQREAIARDDIPGFGVFDTELHQRIFDASGFPAVARVAAPSRAHLDRVRKLNERPEAFPQLIEDHARLVAAMRDDDVDGATAALRVHLRRVLEVLERLERVRPDLFA